MAGLIFEGFIALLLVVTIGYCWRLSRRITLLHKSRQELNKFIHDFNTAIARAEHNITELKALEQKADTSLTSHIEQAKFLVNDLSFLTEKGENVADSLEQQLEVAKSNKPTSTAALQPRQPKRPNLPTLPKRAPAAAPTSTPGATTAIDPERAKAIEQILTSGVLPPQMKKDGALPPSKKQAMDTVLAQIAIHKANIAQPSPTPAPTQTAAPAAATPQQSTPSAPSSSLAASTSGTTTTAARLNETIDRVFNKKRLEQVRNQAETTNH